MAESHRFGQAPATGGDHVPRYRPRNHFTRVLRWCVLAVVWGMITYITVQHQRLGGGPEGAPTVDALCPFGGLATLYRLCAGGEYLQRVFPSSVVLLVGVLLSALLLRRSFCGWICPLGAMQEVFAAVGRRLRLRRNFGGSVVDRDARFLKYVVLVVVITLTWATGTLVFRPYDPWAAYAHLSAGLGELRSEFLVGSIVLLLAVLGSVLVERPYCRYLCPLGGLLGLVARFGATRVVRNDSTCIHCRRCDRACPVDLKVQAMTEVRTTECLTCGECTAVCPIPNTLTLQAARRPVSNLAVGLLALAIFFGTVAGSKALGVWESRPASVAQIIGTGETRDPANIRGFMSLRQIAKAFDLSPETLRDSAALPPSTPLDKPVKDIMGELGRETEELREVVSDLLVKGSGVAGNANAGASRPPPPSSAAAPQPADQQYISGTDTFADLQQRFGVSPERMIELLKLPADTPRDKPLREIMRPLGRHVTEVREAVHNLTGSAKPPATTAPQSAP